MKSKLIYLIVSVLAIFSLTGCGEDSTAGLTHITYYPELTLENSESGEITMYCDKGGAFVDPGYTAIMNGEDVTDQVKVESNVDTSKSGVYSVTYSIVNEDGFLSTASRTVFVTDPNDAVEGVYMTDATSYRSSAGVEVAYGKSYQILIFNTGNGSYSVSDFLGGWYDKRAGYGAAYAMQGTMQAAADGSITMLSSSVPAWGDEADYLKEGKFDAASGTIFWQVGYAGMDFYVTMYKH